MPIKIGQDLQGDFRDPLRLLSDCHRRIELFLKCLKTISADYQGTTLDGEPRQQFEAALRYFRDAAPKHTLDEELSLFPRLRAHESEETVGVFALVDKLQADHKAADTRHKEIDELGRQWLNEGTLRTEETELLIKLLNGLSNTYEKHIALEDNDLFPFAARTLTVPELEAIAGEMATRRGLFITGVRPA